eukprot:403345804
MDIDQISEEISQLETQSAQSTTQNKINNGSTNKFLGRNESSQNSTQSNSKKQSSCISFEQFSDQIPQNIINNPALLNELQKNARDCNNSDKNTQNLLVYNNLQTNEIAKSLQKFHIGIDKNNFIENKIIQIDSSKKKDMTSLQDNLINSQNSQSQGLILKADQIFNKLASSSSNSQAKISSLNNMNTTTSNNKILSETYKNMIINQDGNKGGDAMIESTKHFKNFDLTSKERPQPSQQANLMSRSRRIRENQVCVQRDLELINETQSNESIDDINSESSSNIDKQKQDLYNFDNVRVPKINSDVINQKFVLEYSQSSNQGSFSMVEQTEFLPSIQIAGNPNQWMIKDIKKQIRRKNLNNRRGQGVPNYSQFNQIQENSDNLSKKLESQKTRVSSNFSSKNSELSLLTQQLSLSRSQDKKEQINILQKKQQRFSRDLIGLQGTQIPNNQRGQEIDCLKQLKNFKYNERKNNDTISQLNCSISSARERRHPSIQALAGEENQNINLNSKIKSSTQSKNQILMGEETQSQSHQIIASNDLGDNKQISNSGNSQQSKRLSSIIKNWPSNIGKEQFLLRNLDSVLNQQYPVADISNCSPKQIWQKNNDITDKINISNQSLKLNELQKQTPDFASQKYQISSRQQKYRTQVNNSLELSPQPAVQDNNQVILPQFLNDQSYSNVCQNEIKNTNDGIFPDNLTINFNINNITNNNVIKVKKQVRIKPTIEIQEYDRSPHSHSSRKINKIIFQNIEKQEQQVNRSNRKLINNKNKKENLNLTKISQQVYDMIVEHKNIQSSSDLISIDLEDFDQQNKQANSLYKSLQNSPKHSRKLRNLNFDVKSRDSKGNTLSENLMDHSLTSQHKHDLRSSFTRKSIDSVKDGSQKLKGQLKVRGQFTSNYNKQ